MLFYFKELGGRCNSGAAVSLGGDTCQSSATSTLFCTKVAGVAAVTECAALASP